MLGDQVRASSGWTTTMYRRLDRPRHTLMARAGAPRRPALVRRRSSRTGERTARSDLSSRRAAAQEMLRFDMAALTP